MGIGTGAPIGASEARLLGTCVGSKDCALLAGADERSAWLGCIRILSGAKDGILVLLETTGCSMVLPTLGADDGSSLWVDEICFIVGAADERSSFGED